MPPHLYLLAAIGLALAPLLLAQQPLISEFCADNETILADEDGRYSDWIEILNPTPGTLDLTGYHLTDSLILPTKWTFPSRFLLPGETLIVFASGNGRAPASGELHTNFQLNDAGKYLALIAPDETTVVQEFAPAYPRQYPDVSYGIRLSTDSEALVTEGASASVLIPDNAGALPADWQTAGFSNPTVTGPTGIGFQENPLAPLRTGLIIHSTMDNADTGNGAGTDDSAVASFALGNSEGTDGTAISDNSGGSVTSGANGTIFEALDFSDAVGGNRRATYGNNFDVGTGSYTVSLWVNSRITSTATQFIAAKGNNSSATNGWSIWAENNTLYLRGEFTGSDNSTQNLAVNRPFGSSVQNAWHHIVLVIDNSSGLWTGYYDGLSSGASGTDNGWSIGGGGGEAHTFPAGSDFSNTSELQLGIRNDLLAEWRGTLDDLLIWDRALAPSEVASLHSNGLSGLTVPTAAGGGSPLIITTDIAAEMRGSNASAFVHLPFSVARNPVDFDSLNLRMRYNDGFIAYLNGTEIARRNAPAVPDWLSYATASSTEFADETINISSHIGLLQSSTNSLAIHGLNDEVTDSDFLILPELTASSLTAHPETLRYFPNPSPNALNTAGVSDPLGGVTIDPANGTFAGTQMVTISSGALPAGATIRYTTDGSDPNETAAGYPSPLNIAASSEIRARVFVPDEEGGFVTSAHYIRLAADVQSFTSPLPIIVIDNFGSGQIPNKRAGISAAGDGSGITQLPRQRAYMQIFGDGLTLSGDLANAPDIATNAGIRVRGSSSSSQPVGKQNLSVETWAASDGQSVNITPFGMPSENDWVLYAPYNYDRALIRNTFTYELMRQMGRYASRTQFVEVFINTDGGDLQLSDFVGFYVFMEKVKADSERVNIDPLSTDGAIGGWMISADRMDARPEDGSNTAPYNFHTPGPNRTLQGPYGGSAAADMGGDDIPTGYNTFFNFVEPDGYKTTASQRNTITGWFDVFEDSLYDSTFTDPVTGYRQYLHVGSWVDHYLMTNLTRNVDDLQLSTYLYRPDSNGKLHLNPVWDYDRSMDSYDSRDNSTSGTYGDAFLWFPRLFQDPDFTQEIIDRWQTLRLDTLSTTALHALIDTMAAEITEPVAAANFAKWNAGANTPRAGGWPAEIQHLKGWLESRAAWIDSQYLSPVEFSQNGGEVPDGYQLLQSSPTAGTIYYTMDGTDPRPLASNNSPTIATASAMESTGAVTLNQSVIVTARLFSGGNWSGPTVATFLINTVPASASNLVVSEIMYNPAGPDTAEQALGFADKDEFEFIELLNISPSDTIDLSGVRIIAGVEFNFVESALRFLEPGRRILVVENSDAMKARYGSGLNIAGEYAGALSNGGETLTIIDAAGDSIKTFDYDDSAPWPTVADGDGYSLVLVAPTSNPDHALAASWCPSAGLSGTPGSEDGIDFTPGGDLIDYALANTDPVIYADGAFTYTVDLTAKDAKTSVEISTDLLTWTADSPELQLLSRTHNGDGTETLSWLPTSTGERVFLRLKVTLLTD